MSKIQRPIIPMRLDAESGVLKPGVSFSKTPTYKRIWLPCELYDEIVDGFKNYNSVIIEATDRPLFAIKEKNGST